MSADGFALGRSKVVPLRSPRSGAAHVAAVEQQLLGALLVENGTLQRMPKLRPEHFSHPAHAALFAEIARRVRAERLADAASLSAWWQSLPESVELDGCEYLVTLLKLAAPLPFQAVEYAEIVREEAARRALQVYHEERLEALHAGEPADLARSNAEHGMAQLAAEFPEDVRGCAFEAFDPDCIASLEPRRWVYGTHLLRRYVSVLGAPGGVGKTAMLTAAALAIASGKALLGHRVHERGTVLLAGLEDDADEARRRLGAAMRAHGLTNADIGDRVRILSGRDAELVLARRDKDGLIAAPIVDELIELVRDTEAVAIIADPFVSTHELEENRNDEVNFVVKQWRRVAHEGNCGVWLAHHFRKSGQSGDQDSFRGASALIDAARAALTLAPMQPSEAEELGINPEERRRYVRLDNAKANLAPRPDGAQWFELSSIILPNGDNVQAFCKWQKPHVFSGPPLSVINEFLDEVERASPGYSPRRNAKRWVGYALLRVAEAAGYYLGEGGAKAALAAWFKSGCLIESEGKDAKSNPCLVVRVNAAKRPGAAP